MSSSPRVTDLAIRTGNQMIAEGAVRAGCRFFAGYPITPASGIYKGMIEMLQRRGDLAVNAPDEISALAYCVGASMRGYKAMTATSGPGWALMIETVQYAVMTETPVVIAVVQRLGPSTGGATQGAQGDLMLAEYCTSGGYTIPILCPSTPAQCFELTMRAFAWAETLRTPVVVLSDKEVAMTSERLDYAQLVEPEVLERAVRRRPAGEPPPGTYEFEALHDVPSFEPVGGPDKITATGSTHDMRGVLRKNDPETLEVLQHLESKIQHRRAEMVLLDSDLQSDADTLVLSFGITARTTREAVQLARQRRKRVSTINVLSLFPVPEAPLVEAAARVSRVVVAEENLSGQYRSVLAQLLWNKELVGVNKIGAMITPAEIEAQIL